MMEVSRERINEIRRKRVKFGVLKTDKKVVQGGSSDPTCQSYQMDRESATVF